MADISQHIDSFNLDKFTDIKQKFGLVVADSHTQHTF